jgi:hypothetical protein
MITLVSRHDIGAVIPVGNQIYVRVRMQEDAGLAKFCEAVDIFRKELKQKLNLVVSHNILLRWCHSWVYSSLHPY